MSKQWNELVSALDAAQVEHEYKPLTVFEEEPEEMPWALDLFVRGFIDRRDFEPEPEKKTSPFGDGLNGMVGY